MDKLIEYICEELEELEKKAAKGKLSSAEVEYGDMLAHFKKNLLTADAMEGSNYSNAGRSYGYPVYNYDDGNMNSGRSYAGRYSSRRDRRGRYSRNYANEYSGDMVEQLREMMSDAPDSETRNEIQRLITKIEKM